MKILKYLNKFDGNKTIEILYLAGVFFYSFLYCYGINSSTLIYMPDIVKTVLYFLTLLLIIPKVITQKYTRKEALLSISMLITCLFCIASSGKEMFIIIPLILIGVKNSNMRIIAIMVFCLTTSHALIHLLAFIIDSIKANDIGMLFNFNKAANVNNVYMWNHNDFGAKVVSSYITYIYLTNRNNNRYIKGLALLTIALFIYAICQSWATIIILLLLTMFMFVEKLEIFNKYIKGLSIFSLVFCVAFSVFMMYANLDNSFVAFLDKKLTGRIFLAVLDRQEGGLHFFFPMFSNASLISSSNDNLIVEYLLKWGVLFCIILVAYIIYLGYMHKNDSYNLYLMMVMFIYSVSQRTPRKITLTLIPLLLMYNYFKIEDEKNQDE